MRRGTRYWASILRPAISDPAGLLSCARRPTATPWGALFSEEAIETRLFDQLNGSAVVHCQREVLVAPIVLAEAEEVGDGRAADTQRFSGSVAVPPICDKVP